MNEILKVKRSGGGESSVIIGSVEDNLKNLIQGRRAIIITDSNLYSCYSEIIECYEYILIGKGEKNKTIESVMDIYKELLNRGVDRKSLIVGFGGGIVTDIAGFAASTYMRGLDFGFVATSLLAQVDASVGGKNGVNFEGYKNMIGTFNQPEFVICDIKTLETLPLREFKSGLAEIIKSGLICDKKLFETFEKYNFSEIYSDKELLSKIIKNSISIKRDVVDADEREMGERRKLNLGHTLAHAIEKSSTEFLHGEAVAIGLCMAADISVKLGMLSESDRDKIYDVIESMELPIDSDIDHKTLWNALHSDKKKENEGVHFIAMKGIGNCEVVKLSFEDIAKYIL